MNATPVPPVPSREAVETLQATFAGHAPGYWVADPDLREGMEWNVHILAGSDLLRSNIRICFMANSGGKNPAQDEANANLLAAAPQLAEWVGTLLAEVERLTEAERDSAYITAGNEFENLQAERDELQRTVADQETLMEGDAKTIDDLCEQVGKLRDTVADQAAALAERDKDAGTTAWLIERVVRDAHSGPKQASWWTGTGVDLLDESAWTIDSNNAIKIASIGEATVLLMMLYRETKRDHPYVKKDFTEKFKATEHCWFDAALAASVSSASEEGK